MVMLVILILGASAMLLNALNSATPQLARARVTADALAQAKEALIGRAVADNNHPGSLPCPDTHAPSNAMEGRADSSCTINTLGRLPWKTLGLPDLRDGSGERLWYTLSPNFADNTSNNISSNSNGTLLVYDNSGTSLLTPPGSEAVAIIFAPGAVTGNQQRNSDVDKTTASNYLDTGPNSRNNSSAVGPFITAEKNTSFNDHLMIIRTSDLIHLVEMRVAKELSKAFTNYKTTNGNYPYPAKFSACTSSSCVADASQCFGKVPFSTMSLFLTSMTWFKDNNWYDVIYYAKSCIGALTIQDTNGAPLSTANAIFLMPYSSTAGLTRSNLSTTNLADYFEDAENKNFDAVYIMPTATSNDTLNILP